MSPKPARTCFVCRETTSPDELVRLVEAPDGTVVADLRGKLPGRGAWLHPACLVRLESGKKDPLSRALKTQADRKLVRERIESAVFAALSHGLSVAARAGALVGGQDRLAEALSLGEVSWVLLSSDASPRTVRNLQRAGEETTFVTGPWDADTLGAMVGKGARAALGVRPSKASHPAVLQLRRLAGLGYQALPIEG